MVKQCEDCEMEAVMFEEDGIGWCYEHAVKHAVEEEKKRLEEEKTGISHLDVIDRAMEKKIPLIQAKEELLKEKGRG